MPDRQNSASLKRFERRILRIAVAIAAVLRIGCFGYMTFAGYPLFEAAVQLGGTGRIFNMFCIVIGVATALVSFGVLTEAMIEPELNGYFPKRRRRRMIDILKSHFIVCGYGRVGRSAPEELKKAGVPLLVVDKNEERAEYVSKSLRQAQLAIRKLSGQMNFNPPADAEIGGGDHLIVMGQPAQRRLMEEKIA